MQNCLGNILIFNTCHFTQKQAEKWSKTEGLLKKTEKFEFRAITLEIEEIAFRP